MPRVIGDKTAFGAPGREPSWSPAAKQGIGTANSLASRIWFTIRSGILNEVYYPRVDEPQVRDAQFVFTGEGGLFWDEQRDLEHHISTMDDAQGYRIASQDRNGHFCYMKEIIADPTRACILIRTQFEGDDRFLKGTRIYFLCAPHVSDAGWGNNAYAVEASGRKLLAAERNGTWLAVGASCGFRRVSCGYVGRSDGYTDLAAHREMTLEFDKAERGNVALTGELDSGGAREFTVALGFGETIEAATSGVMQSLGKDYAGQKRVFIEQWKRAAHDRLPLETASYDGGLLYRSSYNVVLAHEDKLFQGAFVASLTIPWGEARNDENGRGGYHLVWARDMVQSALGLLAAGNRDAPVRTLIYLASRQEEYGGFAQEFWVDGTPFRNGKQLDEAAFPVILARRLKIEGLLENFDPSIMVRRSINYLLLSGPVTGEERWEEASGYSPSTLAAVIAAAICAAAFEREGGHASAASFLESYADFLVAHLREWTVSSRGYFVRLNPVKQGEVAGPGDVDRATLSLTSQPPGQPASYPASEITDAGFLELVRYGILRPADPLILRSLQEVDARLKTITPAGPCWRRYDHDGYGQRPGGGPYDVWGKGRSWPLLTGERAHYELAAGQDCRRLMRSMERFAGSTQLLPEQIWDEADIPEKHLYCGGPTGSAMPLVWAHSEYLRLVRSCHDGRVFDLIAEVEQRYAYARPESRVEFWLPKHPIPQARKGCILRVCAPGAFRLRWTKDAWTTWHDADSAPSGIGAEFVDLEEAAVGQGVEFTFLWKDSNRWEGRNFRVKGE